MRETNSEAEIKGAQKNRPLAKHPCPARLQSQGGSFYLLPHHSPSQGLESLMVGQSWPWWGILPKAMEQGIKQTSTQTLEQRQKGNKAITAVSFPDILHSRGPKGTAMRFAQHSSYSNMGEDQVGDLH